MILNERESRHEHVLHVARQMMAHPINQGENSLIL